MRKLIVAEHISLDGVIQSPGGVKEDPSGEFRLGGWIVPYADEAIGHALQDLFSQPFELLLGRRTYDQDGVNLLTWGSGDMVRQLLAAGLVDELWLLIYPVVLGRGKRLFGDNAQASAFTLAHSTSTPGDVLMTHHVRSGEVRTGEFEE
jgi:dihydrofolate reductase